jgi:hypothetical protein
MQYLRKPNYYRHMDFIYRADNGYKLYVGDYYAGRDVGLLKRKKVNSGNVSSYVYSFDCC